MRPGIMAATAVSGATGAEATMPIAVPEVLEEAEVTEVQEAVATVFLFPVRITTILPRTT